MLSQPGFIRSLPPTTQTPVLRTEARTVINAPADVEGDDRRHQPIKPEISPDLMV
jgi:hypothetical protein